MFHNRKVSSTRHGSWLLFKAKGSFWKTPSGSNGWTEERLAELALNQCFFQRWIVVELSRHCERKSCWEIFRKGKYHHVTAIFCCQGSGKADFLKLWVKIWQTAKLSPKWSEEIIKNILRRTNTGIAAGNQSAVPSQISIHLTIIFINPKFTRWGDYRLPV